MSRILVFGHLGQGNVGDELMFKPIISALKRRFPRATFTVLAGDLYDRGYYHAHVLRRKRRTIRQLLVSFLRNDILIVAGGTHLHTPSGTFRYTRSTLRHLVIYTLAKTMGLQVWLIGVGLGPFETAVGRLLGRLAIKAVDFASVRDQESVSWLAKLKMPARCFRACQDPVCYLDVPEQHRLGIHLGISVMCYFRLYSRTPERDDELAARFKEIIEEWLRRFPDSNVSLVAFYSGDRRTDDSGLARRIKAGWPRDARVRVVDPAGRSEHCVEAFRTFSHFVSMRYHSQVLATLFGIPQVVIAYHGKNHAFAADCGLTKDAVVTVEEFVAGNGASIVNHLVEMRPRAFSLPRARHAEGLLPPEDGERQ
ncbi:MAG: polysaccharide pyruvyl transferase family protein [Phycisphaerales bacterium]|nr:MAG: polysaccharide pyruvyl transferase family protein [Phycisphaerales bacterium]